ncbi:MAG TPA: choice-of-anchor D domain-containing protein, partial [Bryobacteraceae bacterium]
MVDAYRARPLAFEQNRGQADPRVQFFARHGSATLFLAASDAVLSLGPSESGKPSFLSLKWVGANASASAVGIDQLPSKANYLIGSDPQKWQNGVSTYARVQYPDIYPGIDLIYYGDQGQLEYDLTLAPGASPQRIRMNLKGISKMDVSRSGDLVLTDAGEEVRFHKPVAYQTTGTGRVAVEARYIRIGRSDIGFELGEYDHTKTVVIDPQLSYSSYLGGSGSDDGARIAVDSLGNAYIVGVSGSLDYPLVAPYQGISSGSTSVVISKLNPEAAGASALVYSTYLGGNGQNVGRAIAVDSMNQIYIVGDTNAPNFPVTTGAYQPACKQLAGVCSTDAFAVKLDASGSTLLYSTYLGGSQTEFGFAITVDLGGHMFVGVNAGSPDMPVTPGAFQPTFAGGGNKYGDAWVAELNPGNQSSADLLYATYLGGSGSEQLYALAVDGTGAIDVTGSTASNNFPVTPSAFKTTYSGTGSLGLGDAFVAKLNPGGHGSADLVYSTYLGGANDDRGEGIAIDSINRIYVTGLTGSAGFPVTPLTAFQATFGGGNCNGVCDDAFIAQLDPSQSGAASLVYSTFFGGSSFDLGHSIALDSSGLVYITGETASLNFPLVNPIQNTCFGGCTPLPIDDIFIAKFDLSMSGTAGLLFSTYLGGNDVDTGWGIAVDSKGDALVTGQTFSTNLPTQIPFQASCDNCVSFLNTNRSGDAFLVKVCITSCPSGSPSPASVTFGNQNIGTTSASQGVTFANVGSADLTIASVTITGANAADFGQTNNCPAILAAAANCQINVTFTPAAAGSRAANISITNNGKNVPQTIALSGTGVAPVVGLSTSTLSFGSQTINTSSAAQPVTVTNNGPGALTISGIAITGTNAGEYRQTNNCPATLGLNANCTINVTFTPAASGSRVASLAIADNGVSDPQTVVLSGTGAGAGSGPWPNGYSYQATFTVTAGKVTGSQTNFPALISGTYPDFKSSANGGRVLNTCTQTVGNRTVTVPCDLIFTSDAAGTALLSWEIESYNPVTGALIAWVNVPSLSSGTVLYGWYGNASVVSLQSSFASTWNSNYLGIWHFSEDPSGAPPQMNDSTAGL